MGSRRNFKSKMYCSLSNEKIFGQKYLLNVGSVGLGISQFFKIFK